jgi:hypothetical protein
LNRLRVHTVRVQYVCRMEVNERSAVRDAEMTHDSAQSTPHTMRYVKGDFRADVITSCILQWGHLTEWLRWWTRNPLGNSRVGPAPLVNVLHC